MEGKGRVGENGRHDCLKSSCLQSMSVRVRWDVKEKREKEEEKGVREEKRKRRKRKRRKKRKGKWRI